MSRQFIYRKPARQGAWASYLARLISPTKTRFALLGCTVLFGLSGCIEPYLPPVIRQEVDILVIDGFLNSTEASATVRLTHARSLSNESNIVAEVNAAVSIQAEDGSIYDLPEGDPGMYAITGLDVDPTTKYILRVRTADEAEYVSDLTEITTTPAIDSVTWSANEDGVNILINTHDQSGASRYYRWDYIETWQYHAPVSSDFKLVGQTPVYRTDEERIYTCWHTLPSTKISITTSVRLADDVIHQYPVTFLPRGSSKISVKYSVLVRQRVASKAEYNFLEQLQKTTESLGGLFDPQPSQVTGNIHNVSDPLAPVLGYFSAGTVTEERLFLDYSDLPDPLKKLTRPLGCEVDSISVSDLQNLNGSELLGSAIYSGPFIVGYTKSSPSCADCRFSGGVTTKPSFWP